MEQLGFFIPGVQGKGPSELAHAGSPGSTRVLLTLSPGPAAPPSSASHIGAFSPQPLVGCLSQAGCAGIFMAGKACRVALGVYKEIRRNSKPEL